MIDYSIALKLHNSLAKYHQLSDFHSVSPADLAVRVIHEAGLHTAYIPLAKTSRKDCRDFVMHLAVVDPMRHNLLSLSFKDTVPTKVYALVALRPMTDYVGDLFDCCLTKLWWSAPEFFHAMASIIAPSWGAYSEKEGGRSGWGAQDRAAMSKGFAEFWTPETSVKPMVPVPPKRLRFTTITTLPLPSSTPPDNH
jgi:hypothetical protein